MGVLNSAKNCKQCKCELFINPGWGNGNNNKSAEPVWHYYGAPGEQAGMVVDRLV